MPTRAAYVAALRRERAHLEQTGQTHRLVEVDKQLERFDANPVRRTIEKATERRRRG